MKKRYVEHSIARWKDANGTQSILQLQDRIVKQFQGTLAGKWTGTLRLYRDSAVVTNARKQASQLKQLQLSRPTPGQAAVMNEVSRHANQTLYQLTLSSIPNKVFSWSPEAYIESDTNLELILSKLTNVWVPRQSAQIEGYVFELGDFIVRAANLTVGTSYKGILLEVEYQPSNHPALGLPLAQELLDEILPKPVASALFSMPNPTAPNVSYPGAIEWSKVGLSSRSYTPLHTSYQYRSLFDQDKLL